MIILVSASSRAKECAAAIEQKNHLETPVAASLFPVYVNLALDQTDPVALEVRHVRKISCAATLAVPCPDCITLRD